MTGTIKSPQETSREEDFRDYKERDLDDGWPYPDEDDSRVKRNEAYGEVPAGLEADGNEGVEIAANPAIQSAGGPSLSRAIAGEAIEDDALEEEIFNRIMDEQGLDDQQVTVTVREGVVDITGEVETRDVADRITRIAAATKGVREVRNGLVTIGVDSHIPADTNS